MKKRVWQVDFVSLRLFIAVCEETTFAQAAEREAIVASAVSKRIADLEESIGTSLLLRHRSGVTPTPAGEALLQHARSILRGVEKMQGELSESPILHSASSRLKRSSRINLPWACAPFH